jgi:plasmid stabilization system protein ParE
MRIEILDSAQDDLIAGHDFYENQAQGLGTYFLDTLFSDIDSLRLFAGMHAVHFGRYHRLLSKRFPFAVYYRVEGDVARVYAVLDCRQNPRRIADRLTDQPQS